MLSDETVWQLNDDNDDPVAALLTTKTRTDTATNKMV